MPRSEFYYDEKRKQYRKRVNIDGVMRDVWADTKTELRARLDELKAQQAAGVKLNDKTTFAEYALRWLPLVTAGLTPSGANDYKNAVNNWLIPRFGDRPLRDLRPLDADELLRDMSDKSRSSQHKILFVFRRLMDSAEENGLILRNPAARKKAGGESAAEKEPLTDAQQEMLLAAVKGTRVHLFVALGLYTGLRREEILGLHWVDVHMGDGESSPWLGVRHVVRFDHGRPILSETLKSKAARRDIPIPPPLLDVLQTERALISAGKRPASVLVVPSASGEVCTSSAFRELWGIVERRQKTGPEDQTPKNTPKIHRCERVLDFRVTPHLLRHTYITRLCASGLDIKKIQYLAGHSDPAITLRIYSHVVGNRPDDIYDKIAKAFSTRSGSVSGSDDRNSPDTSSKNA